MDMDNEGNTPIRHEGEENRQVNVWSPEDAARFLSSAIQQTQRPLTDALNKRSVSPGIFALVIVLLVAAAAACGWVLLDRLEKTENAAESARNLREQALVQQHEIKSKHDVVAARLNTTQEQLDRVRHDLETENERLRTEATGFKLNEEETRRLKNDIQRYRRHNELLRNQISGLEMEKQALGRQLSAVKAIAAGDDMYEDFDMDDPLEPAPAPQQQQPQTEVAPVVAAPAQPVVSEEPAEAEPVVPKESLEVEPVIPEESLEVEQVVPEETVEMSPTPLTEEEPEAAPAETIDDEPAPQTQPSIRDYENTL